MVCVRRGSQARMRAPGPRPRPRVPARTRTLACCGRHAHTLPPQPRPKHTGLSTNFDKLCGCVLQDMVDPAKYLEQFPEAFEPMKPKFDRTAISELYDSIDFIGARARARF